MILWGTSSPSRWSVGFPNKVAIPFPKTSSLCELKSNMRLESEHIHEILAEVSFILDKIHRRHSHNWYLWFKRRYADGQQAYEKMLSIALSRERQIDTARRYHLIPIIMAIIRQLMNNRCWRGCGEEGNPLTLLVECKLVQSPWKTVWKFLKKNKNRVSIWSNNSNPEHISVKNYTLKRFMHPYVHSSKTYDSQDMETA